MTYRLKVNQQWKIVLALIFIPVFFTLVYVAFILQFRNLPDWVILTSVIIVLGASLATTLFVVFKWLTVECEITVDERQFHFKLIRETPFMHLHEFSCNWENISNVSINIDQQHDAVFYSVEFRRPGMTLYLSDIPRQTIGDGSGSDFWKELSRFADQYNQGTQSPEMRIRDIGFYEKPWAKVFTYFALVFSFLFIITSLFAPGERMWLRTIAFCSFAIPWVVNYFRAKNKRKKNSAS